MMILPELLSLLVHLAEYVSHALLQVLLVPEQPLMYLLLHLGLGVPLVLYVTHPLHLCVLLPSELPHQHLTCPV